MSNRTFGLRTGRPAAGRKALLLMVTALLTFLSSVAHAAGDPNYRNFPLFKPDITAPEIEIISPAANSLTRDSLTPIELHVVDPFRFWSNTSRLYVPSLSFTVNGVDQSANVIVMAEGLARWFPWLLPPRTAAIHYRPTEQSPLPDGVVNYTFSISDRAGNVAQSASQFTVDTQGPTIVAVAPQSGDVITDLLTPLTYRLTDSVAGVDPASIAVTFVGGAGAGTPSLNGDLLTIAAPSAGWAEGELGVQITVDDQASNRTTTAFSYTVAPRVELAAYPRATPSAGDAPLRVVFTPDVVTITAIERYEWDFQGDGVYDRTETVGSNQTFTYTTVGQYTANLRVTDTRGVQAIGTVVVSVNNRPPDVAAEAAPSNGSPPLTVAFTANATDSNGVASYEWDFQGDGVYEVSGAANTATFTYESDGVFQPRVRVTDTLGAASVLSVPSIEVRVATGAPSVAGSASPTTGNAPLNVNFSATATDPDGEAVTEWAWDFDGDGAYDYVSPSSASATNRYTAPGTFFARVRATTSDGGIGVDVVRVIVNLTLGLTLSTDTIDTNLSESVSVNTTLGGDTLASIVIEDANGAVVRTLAPFTQRAAGPYSDLWDGRDDAGEIVAEGEYRAILLYRFDAETRRLDLGLTTGGVQSNPPRSPIPRRFAPLAGRPLVISYTLNRASQVTAFMGRFNVNTRLITFNQRDPKGRGTHTIVWNGENTDGQLIHPPSNDSFLFGIFAYTMPNNAIFVRSGVHVSAVQGAPSIYDPTTSADDGAPALSSIAFTMSRAGSVELSVHDATTGVLVLRRTIPGIGAGAQSITWDGRNNEGVLVAPGRYRIGVAGVDESGARSSSVYALQRVYY
ncbi:MAG: PKD domain-containing protein [Steroidobacter sp.]